MDKKQLIKKRMLKTSINFSCAQCGACCSVGFIYLKRGESEKIASYLKMPVKEFKEKYTKWFVWQGRALKWDDAGACVFLKNNKCSVYNVRPFQCASYPLWPRLMKNKKDLAAAKKYCKGLK